MHTALDVKKRLLKVDKVIGETTVTKVFESTVTLPIKAIKIFDVVASLSNVRGEVREGGVLVTGLIKKQLFIVDEGDLVRHVPEEIPFRQFIEVPGAKPNLKVQIKATIVDIQTHLTDKGKKVRQEVIIEIFVKVTETEQLMVVTDVKGGPKDLKVEKKLLKVESVIGEDRVSEVIKNTVELPITAKKIFQIVSEVRDVKTEIKRDIVIVRGIVHKQIFLVDEGDLVRHVAEDVPFSVAVNIPGARDGLNVQVDVNAIVDDFELIRPPSKKLRQNIILDIFVKVTETLQIEVVTNVTGTGIIVDRKLLKVEQVVADVIQTTTVEAEVELPMKAEKIFRIMAEIVNIQTEIVNGKVIIRAVLHKQIFFVDMGGLLRHVREDVPFQIVANVPPAVPDMNVQVRLRIVGDIDFEIIKGKKVLQTAVIEAFIKITETEQLKVVIDVRAEKPFPPKPPKPPIPPKPPFPPRPTTRFVIVQKGDTLFKIAQREGVSLDALIRANPQIKDPNLIFPGQKVFIPTKPKPPTKFVIVQKGDTLFKIAQREGVSLDALIRANPQIKDPNLIFPGQKVFIPTKW
ncbi:SafA/ExsA family spore coat assembly protein [Candidatus Contubernalis alkaliaceticus]|uniref:SafA/ExsA family spore coat assembly protein n=1 Tax=Candidatus Contubernalis alkaliaceticus TaxID=338645 RepID=UPI001F4BF2BF|nr:SafA/ExsA family spore coat assembly protein [Candidatus Contubernalis alkalaceticus]UNC91782.1 SafA/ExsA family spore coat assembly protein [Candidatus Contubernalis alkalaceticus]